MEEFKKVMYDYLYVKIVRNMINHAVEDQNFNNENGKRFADLGYGIYDEKSDRLLIDIKTIAKNIENGINLLERHNK